MRTFLEQRRWTEAERELREVLRENPREAQAWVWLGEALEQFGDVNAAWHCYDRGWILDPQASWAEGVFRRIGNRQGTALSAWLESLLQVPRVRVVGAVLARDEAENIRLCLEALKPAVDDIVVVDTGSVDGTPDIARSMGAQVVEAEWKDDFGLARNAALPVLGDRGWVLWVDADEFLDPADVHVPRVVAGLWDGVEPTCLIRIVQVNYVGDKADPNYDTTRFYPLGRGIVWHGRIHEQVVFSSPPVAMQRAVARIRLRHRGYDPLVMQRRGKLERNIRLLRQWVAEEPENPAAWGFLGRDLYVAGRLEEAVSALYRAEAAAQRDSLYARLPEVRAVLCEALVRLNRAEEARIVATRLVLGDPEFPTGWYWQAQSNLVHADHLIREALEAVRKVRNLAPGYRGIVTVPSEVVNFLSVVAEADALKVLGRWVEALELYRRALVVNPNHDGVKNQVEWIESQAKRIVEMLATTSTGSRDSRQLGGP